MAELSRVPAPRSPFGGWRGPLVSVVVIGVLAAVAKPWGASPAPDRAVASATPDTTTPPVLLEPIGRAYDPTRFGTVAPPADWAIVTASGTTSLAFLETPESGPAVSTIDAPATPIVSGPVVDLGTTDDVDVALLTHPIATTLSAVRLWRFVDGAAPRRVELDRRLEAPWPAGHIAVIAQRQSGMEDGRVLPWSAGLYRLDLLIEPEGRVRSVMLHVAPGSRDPAAHDGAIEPPRTGESFRPSTLDLLPDSANLWSAGGFLSGWRRETSHPGCRVAEIWRATDPADECWPVPLGRTNAVGVNLPGGEAVSAIELEGIDPLPGPIDLLAQTNVAGRAGLALVREPVGILPDGIYRLDVRTTRGDDLTWYLEVGPIGRAVASYYEASTSR